MRNIVDEYGAGWLLSQAGVLGRLAGRVEVAYLCGMRPGDSRWVRNADLDDDGVIDILDASTVAYYYGTHA